LFDTLKEVEKSFHFTIVLKDSARNVSPRDTIPVEFAHEVLIETNEEKTTSKPLNANNIWGKYSPFCGTLVQMQLKHPRSISETRQRLRID
jgi:hypothetical protein